MLRISVITPSFNQGRFLARTIRSVLGQDYPAFEYIIIDGGSTDESVDIIKKYASRLTYWVSEADGGQGDAIAKGFARATGDVLCWLNSDDVFLPGALRKIAEFFDSHPGAEIVSAGAYLIDAGGKPVRKLYGNYTLGVPASYNRLRFYGQDGLYQQATFWRWETYVASGGVNPGYTFALDLDLFARMARQKRIERLPAMVACFRLHDQSKTTLLEHVRLSEVEVFRQIHQGSLYRSGLAWAAFWYYRLLNRARKVRLSLLLFSGAVRLAPEPAYGGDSDL